MARLRSRYTAAPLKDNSILIKTNSREIPKFRNRIPLAKRMPNVGIGAWGSDSSRLMLNRQCTCAVKRRWSTAGESPARELGSLHPEAIGAAVEETKPSEPPV